MITVPIWTTWQRGEMVGYSDATVDAPGGWAALDKFEVCVDARGYDRKPDRLEIGRISSRILGCKTTVNVYQLAVAISQGRTVLPAICKPTRSPKCWKSQRLFFLDLDNDEALRRRGLAPVTMAQALRRGYQAGYRPVLAYPSFSSGASLDEPGAYESKAARFRVVFDAMVTFTDPTERDKYAAGLALAFPEADPQSLEKNRMFLGTSKGVIECVHEAGF